MKITKRLLVGLLIIQWATGFSVGRAKLVHNVYQEIEACKGKLKLELLRVWGGENEEDEHKFFKLPVAVLVDKKESVYICDQNNQHIRVYDNSGESFRVIGRPGQGPGDLYGPMSIAFSPMGDLWVAEIAGRRIQCFNSSGRSKTIFRSKRFVEWIGVTSRNEIATYGRLSTFYSRKLLDIRNNKGKLLRRIGAYHDKSKVPMT
ncbi:MAG: hypothetical protein GY940_17880, partial [bacterium]|nr:hypothetical protein [bacterium]